MNFVRHAENRPGQDPQIFSSRSNHYFSNAGGCLGKIQCRRAGGKNLNGSNRRTVFSMANETTTNYLPPHPKPDNNQKPLTRCPFFRSKPRADTLEVIPSASKAVLAGNKCGFLTTFFQRGKKQNEA